MTMKGLASGALALAIVTGSAYFYVQYERKQKIARFSKPNILLLSFCSLRPQHLRAYNSNAEPLPALDRFFNESLVFTNAMNGLPWTNVTNYVVPSSLRALGYSNAKRKSLRIPLVPIHKNMPANELNKELDFNDPAVRNYELSYRDGFQALKKAITTTEVRPFFYSVHLKYMHFPLIDEVNQKDLWRQEFSRESAETLDRYLKNPSLYPEKAALLLTLFADPSLVRDNPYVQKYNHGRPPVRIGQIYQVLSDPELLSAWKKSQGYATDIRILHESYSLKLRNLDAQLAEVLDLYGRQDLKETTAVIITGDHGESLLENDLFLHANHIFDEQIRFPMAIRAAGPAKRGLISDQYSMDLQNKLLQIVADTNAEPESIRNYIRQKGDSVYLRNCQGTVDGLRTASGYKLVSDLSGFKLFNVAADPLHLVDLRFDKPDLFFKLKELLFELRSRPQNLLACDSYEKRGAPLHSKSRPSKYQ